MPALGHLVNNAPSRQRIACQRCGFTARLDYYKVCLINLSLEVKLCSVLLTDLKEITRL